MKNPPKQSSKNQLLLIEDVDDLGRSGDVVRVRPGYARNFLLPSRKAVVADKFTLRLQEKLQSERAKRAEVDKKDAEILSEKINPMVLSTIVRVDPDGHMYGSVAAIDIVRIMEKEGITIERRNVVLPHAIRELGEHRITLKLKEGVPASFKLIVEPDIVLPPKEVAAAPAPEAPAPEAPPAEEKK